jgi:membrane protein DedA with SNARE-associated domain
MGHHGLTQQIIELIERHGYAILFCWVLAEQGALPIPSVPLLVVVGSLIRTGRLHPAAAMLCCLAAALLADNVWFQLGRRRGKRILSFLCRISLEPDSCVSQTENSFTRHGLVTVLFAKFVPGLNSVAAPLAGVSGVAVTRFLAVDTLGITIWSSVYMGVGYLFADQLEDVVAHAQRWGSGFVLLVAGLFAAWILRKFIQRRRFLKKLDVNRITPEDLRDRLAAGETPYMVDLRSRLEIDATSVPGAIRLSFEDLAVKAKQIPRDRDIVLLCS